VGKWLDGFRRFISSHNPPHTKPIVDMRSWLEDDLLRAVAALRVHLDNNPQDFAEWFDLGLAYKFLCDWRGCIAANSAILEHKDEPGNPAWWNLGIAATAVRDWTLARSAWRGYGLIIPDGDGPVIANYGSAAIRLKDGEVVWGERIDPARAVIRNVPFPESKHRWGDIVLHDGAPNGERRIGKASYPVFDELERVVPSEVPTIEVIVRCDNNNDSVALVDAFEAAGFAAEDWTTNVRPLCRSCSESRADEHIHPIVTRDAERHFGLASPMGIAMQLLETWQSQSPSTRGHAAPDLRG
jgi:hypothetical protein